MIAALLVRLGLSQRVAAIAAPFAAAIAVIALLMALWGAWQAFDWFNDRDAIKRDRIEANAKITQRQLEAASQSAQEALRNQETNIETRRAFKDAIHYPEPGDSADPDVRLACEQLRRSGQDTTGIPECGNR